LILSLLFFRHLLDFCDGVFNQPAMPDPSGPMETGCLKPSLFK
jgi:hypothetical protein